jgi:hypothetical protein
MWKQFVEDCGEDWTPPVREKQFRVVGDKNCSNCRGAGGFCKREKLPNGKWKDNYIVCKCQHQEEITYEAM